MTRRMLEAARQPEVFRITIPQDALPLVDAAEAELAERASQDESGCWGYFNPQRDRDLTASRSLRKSWPRTSRHDNYFAFSWLRYSLGWNPALPMYHLDANADNGLQEGQPDNVAEPFDGPPIWRVVANLHQEAQRQIAYLNVEPRDLAWKHELGAVNLAESETLDVFEEQTVLLNPREGRQVWAAAICVSHVAHAGIETAKGHFLASWSRSAA